MTGGFAEYNTKVLISHTATSLRVEPSCHMSSRSTSIDSCRCCCFILWKCLRADTACFYWLSLIAEEIDFDSGNQSRAQTPTVNRNTSGTVTPFSSISILISHLYYDGCDSDGGVEPTGFDGRTRFSDLYELIMFLSQIDLLWIFWPPTWICPAKEQPGNSTLMKSLKKGHRWVTSAS